MYRSPRERPPQQRGAAVVTAITGILSLCIGFGFSAAAIGAALMQDFGIAAAVSAGCGVGFLMVAVLLLRHANRQWGWPE